MPTGLPAEGMEGIAGWRTAADGRTLAGSYFNMVLMKESQESLTDNEVDEIKKSLKSSYLTVSLMGIMIILLMQLIYFIGTFKLSILNFELISTALLVGIIFLPKILNRNLRNDLNQGLKIINEYVIESKDSYQDDDPGIGGWKTTYYFKSEDRQFLVNKDLYETAETGDFYLEHVTPKAQKELKIEIKKK